MMNALSMLVVVYFSACSCASFSALGIQGLNPENDPIYDPVTGKWAMDTSKDPVYVPTIKTSPTSMSNGAFNLAQLKTDYDNDDSSSSATSFFSPLSSPFTSPSFDLANVLSPNSKGSNVSMESTTDFESTSDYYIPLKCRRSKRSWIFHSGLVQDYTRALGEISHLQHARDMINDLELPRSNIAYSLIRQSYDNPEKLAKVLPHAYSLLIACPPKRAFTSLYALSADLSRNANGLVIAVNVFFLEKDQDVIIEIIVDEYLKNRVFFDKNFRKLIAKVFPNVSDYIPYN